MKALIIDIVSEKIAESLRRNGVEAETVVMPGAERLAEIIGDADILVMRVLPAIDRKILDAAKRLKLIAVCSVGTAHIDMAYAEERGITVVNAPGASANAVAELALCKMLELSRHTVDAQREVVGRRIWEKNHFVGHELKGRTLGIVGFGRIGQRVGELARAFGMKIVVYDPYLTVEQCAAGGGRKLGKEEVLRIADILLLQIPLTPETDNMISFKEIDMMRDGAVIINMSRGGILNEEAAAEALRSGKLSGVGSDVLKEELTDISSEAVLRSPLFEAERGYVITPHIGACTEEAQDAIGQMISEKIGAFFGWGPDIPGGRKDVR